MIEYAMFPFHVIKNDVIDFVANNNPNELGEEVGVDIDYDYYEMMSYDGAGYVVCALDSQKIVGISSYVIRQNTNNKKEKVADNVNILVNEKYRGSVAKELLSKSKEALKKIGVDKVSFLVCSDRLGNFLKRNGFEVGKKEWSFEL